MILRLVILAFFLALNFVTLKQPLENESLNADRFVRQADSMPDATQTVAYGRALLRRGKDIPDALTQCKSLSGCATGVMIEAASREKYSMIDAASFAGGLEDEVCSENANDLLCWYNLGQSFYELSSQNIEQSTGLCKRLHNKTEIAYKYCVGGVFRRWYLAVDGTKALCWKYPEFVHQCAISVMTARRESLGHVD